ncbi:MAG: ComEC/Rec2 family competence protein [Thermoleophilia bacterium]
MRSVSQWLLARGGVSRLALAAMAVGLGAAGLRSPAAGPWIAGTLAVSGVLIVVQIGHNVRVPPGPESASGYAIAPLLVVLLGLLMGVSFGSVRTAALLEGELARSAAVPGSSFKGEVVVTGRPQGRGSSVVASARSLGPVGSGEELLVEIGGIPPEAATATGGEVPGLGPVEEGSILHVEGVLRRPKSPSGADPASFDEASWLRRQGIAAVVTVRASQASVVGARRGPAGLFDRLRSRARAHLALGIDPAMGGLLRGFILGDKSGIQPATLETFRRAGTAHLLAVSGLHVVSLAVAVLLAARMAGLPPWLRSVGAGATAVAFMLLTGAGPSVVRATVMVLVMLGAGLVGRGRDSWAAVALAAIVVLAREPPAVGSAGFQLSFSAVIALLLLARPLETRLARHLPPSLATGVGVSVAAAVGTAPVSLLTFGQVSAVSVAANPLVVPVVPLVMALGTLSIVTGFAWPGACVVLNTIAGTVIGWVTVVSRVFAAAPVLTGGDVLPLVAALAGGVCAWVAWTRVPLRRSRPRAIGRSNGPAAALVSVGVVVLGAATGVGLLGGGTAAVAGVDVWWAGRSWPSGGEVRVLDVGEGAAVLVRSPERVAVLIDAGQGGRGLAGQLRRLGVGRLDAVVVTHPHADHYEGLSDVLPGVSARLLVDHVVDGGGPLALSDESAAYLTLQRAALRDEARHLVPQSGEAVEIGDVRLEFLAPSAPLVARGAGGWCSAEEGWAEGEATQIGVGLPLTSERLNQASLVVVVRVGGLAILVPGDAESDVLTRYPLPDVDALVVAHHGSEGAVTVPILDRLTPAVAVVPVGAGNTFGHPAPETERLLGEWGAAVLRTDHSGWVALRPAGAGALEVAVER